MLKEILLTVLMALCLAQADIILDSRTETADMQFLLKQRRIYELLLFIEQPILKDTEWYEIGSKYHIESNIQRYTDEKVVEDLILLWKHHYMLPKGVVFSPLYKEHREEMYLLFKVLMVSKDFETFYKTASWARIHMNEGLFMNALTVAVFHRPETKHLRLPAPHEVYPHLFFDADVIEEARKIKMIRSNHSPMIDMVNMDSYVIHVNSSLDHVKLTIDDSLLDYFMEDPSLNGYYFYLRNIMPLWLKSEELHMIPKDIRGTLFYWMHKQLINRYELERISSGVEKIEIIDWHKELLPTYQSTLKYTNGVMIPLRNHWTTMIPKKLKYLKEIEILEHRILDAIDSGWVINLVGQKVDIYTPEGFNILGNIIEGNKDSLNLRYYGLFDVLARDVLGLNLENKVKDVVLPSMLQMYSTSMRDPIFYRLYDRILSYFERFRQHLPKYTMGELNFPGVIIDNVHVDKLETFVDHCDSVINNAVAVGSLSAGLSFRIGARRSCLNYTPFTYHISVKSDKDVKAMVKIFLGPAVEEKHLTMDVLHKHYKHFVEMDRFVTKLTLGMNNIKRRSDESIYTMPDMIPSDVFYEKLKKAISGSEPLTYEQKIFGFPERLTLPKGRIEGMKYKLFVVVYPYDEAKVTTIDLPVFGKMLLDGKSLDYPLDRPMWLLKFITPNMFLKNVYVYHSEKKIVME